ncbi:MAG TPA: carboxypeptidase regulatory-like domain-containing protein, partial [Planctomycetota bacterium]|nr:carboxypeptidase regulatory-like domain-containing protein [Planctomycetota bacterium]
HRRANARRSERERAAAEARSTESADRLLERAAAHRALVGAVMALPEPLRAAILMRYLEGLAPREIAKHTGAPVRTIHTRIQRGLAKLRTSLPTRRGDASWAAVLAPWRASTGRGLLMKAVVMTTEAKLASVGIAALLLVAAWMLATRPSAAVEGGAATSRLAASSVPSVPEAGEPGGDARVSVAAASPPATRPALADDDALELRGKVVDSAGVPIDGASIEVATDVLRYTHVRVASAEASAAMRNVIAKARSAADGTFRVPVAERRNFDVTAQSTGFASRTVPDRHAGETFVITLRRGARIEGRVTTSGRPVVGARVVGVSRRSRLDLPQTGPVATDAEGRYALADLDPGEWEVQVESPRTVRDWSTHVAVEEDETARRDIEVREGTYVYGRVIDADTKRPIADAEVSDDWWFGRVARTKGDGLYMLEGVEGPIGLYARAPGYATERAALPPLPEAGLEHAFALHRGHGARGRIVDAAGAPVSGAYVLAANEQEDHRDTVTGADGTFDLRDLHDRFHHTLLIRKEGFGSAQYVFPPREGIDALVDFGDLALEPAASIRGVVRSLDGLPIAACEMMLDGVNADTDRFAEGREFEGEIVTGNLRVYTDARGRFAFADRAAGTYAVRAWVPGSSTTKTRSVTVGPAQQVEDCDFDLDVGLPLRGVIRRPDGQPAAAFYVAVRLEETRTSENWRDPVYQHTNLRGEFSFSGLEPGACFLRVVEDGLKGSIDGLCAPDTTWPVVAGSESVTIVLPPNAPIEGVVVDSFGDPVEGAYVCELVPFSMAGTRPTDAEGRFRFPCRQGTEVQLRAEYQVKADHDPRTPGVSVQATSPRVAAGTKNVRIQLPPLAASAPADAGR